IYRFPSGPSGCTDSDTDRYSEISMPPLAFSRMPPHGSRNCTWRAKESSKVLRLERQFAPTPHDQSSNPKGRESRYRYPDARAFCTEFCSPVALEKGSRDGSYETSTAAASVASSGACRYENLSHTMPMAYTRTTIPPALQNILQNLSFCIWLSLGF